MAATTSRGIAPTGWLQERRVGAAFARASSIKPRTRVQIKGLVVPTARSFRALRTIRKLSPRLTRSLSRRLGHSMRLTATSAALPAETSRSFRIPQTPKEDDVMRPDDETSGSTGSSDAASAVVDTVNAVLADIVDGQKFIEETGRTQPRPMKRRQLVMSLALGGLRGPLHDADSRLGCLRRTSSRLSRTPSTGSGFARTAHLVSQLSFDAPSPHDAPQTH